MVELNPKVGTEIKIDRATLLSGAVSAQLRQRLHEHGVLLFREMNLTDGEMMQFGKTVGQIGLDYNPPEMLQVLLSNPTEYEKGAFYWHIDDITEARLRFAVGVRKRRRTKGGLSGFTTERPAGARHRQ